ncbi:MAG: tRNA-dihydrouridine synthase family protein, partial [Verrucomicrobiota bacterium]
MLPKLSLAPMQDVSTLPLWRSMARRGAPDLWVTEYFRVHQHSKPNPTILRSITHNDTGIPVIAQMIGNTPEYLVKMVHDLQEKSDCVGIDVNLGCPAPRVCGKNSGGALLLNHALIREIAETLRPVVTGTLTFKTRVGFESEAEFDALLELFAELPLDGLAIHGRTVREKYQSEVHTDEIASAVKRLPYPVTANGSIVCNQTARSMVEKTGAAGLMVGRGAIRNPWIYQQIRQELEGQPIFRPTLLDVKDYLFDLYAEI